MRIIHISDLHFGPRHWEGNDSLLVEKINLYRPDLVIDTGDATSDGLESEFKQAGKFLSMIDCQDRISIIGNHDKRSMTSHILFRSYIYSPEIIRIDNNGEITKNNVYLDQNKTRIIDYYTEINFLKLIEIGYKNFLFICIDSNVLYEDNGFVELKVLDELSERISHLSYDIPLLLIHHSVLQTNEDPLSNSQKVIDFINMHKIGYVLCGHTHEIDVRKSSDLITHHQFIQFMCGTTASCSVPRGDNVFLIYDNLGMNNFHVTLVRIHLAGSKMEFFEEKIF